MDDGDSPPYASDVGTQGSRPRICQAQGCDVDVTPHGRYCIKRRLCPEHLKAPSLLRKRHGNEPWRFCQQCGKLELLTCFDGSKRSCRVQLARRRASNAPHRKRSGGGGHSHSSRNNRNQGDAADQAAVPEPDAQDAEEQEAAIIAAAAQAAATASGDATESNMPLDLHAWLQQQQQQLQLQEQLLLQKQTVLERKQALLQLRQQQQLQQEQLPSHSSAETSTAIAAFASDDQAAAESAAAVVAAAAAGPSGDLPSSMLLQAYQQQQHQHQLISNNPDIYSRAALSSEAGMSLAAAAGFPEGFFTAAAGVQSQLMGDVQMNNTASAAVPGTAAAAAANASQHRPGYRTAVSAPAAAHDCEGDVIMGLLHMASTDQPTSADAAMQQLLAAVTARTGPTSFQTSQQAVQQQQQMPSLQHLQQQLQQMQEAQTQLEGQQHDHFAVGSFSSRSGWAPAAGALPYQDNMTGLAGAGLTGLGDGTAPGSSCSMPSLSSPFSMHGGVHGLAAQAKPQGSSMPGLAAAALRDGDSSNLHGLLSGVVSGYAASPSAAAAGPAPFSGLLGANLPGMPVSASLGYGHLALQQQHQQMFGPGSDAQWLVPVQPSIQPQQQHPHHPMPMLGGVPHAPAAASSVSHPAPAAELMLRGQPEANMNGLMQMQPGDQQQQEVTDNVTATMTEILEAFLDMDSEQQPATSAAAGTQLHWPMP